MTIKTLFQHGHSSASKTVAILLFIIYALVGLLCVGDYGCGPDEGMERQTSLVNFRYVIEKLDIPISKANVTWLAYLPELSEYRDRYYGTALHLPLVLIESASGFSMEPVEFYGLRHLYTFLNFFVSVICFYLLLRYRFENRWYAIAGALMMILSPRFFAESFYNNKDVLFMAWYIFSIFFVYRWMQEKSTKNAIIAGIVLAFTCNTRFNAIVFFPILACFWLYDLLARKTGNSKEVISFFVLLVSSVIVFFLITPNFWEHPFTTLYETFAFNEHHPNHGSDGNLFFGNLIDAAKTWYYIPVWIFLTTPLCYLLLSLSGVIKMGRDVITKKLDYLICPKNRLDTFFFCVGFLPVCVIIALHVVIYNGWRHCYFAYPSIIYFAVVGLNYSLQILSQRNSQKKKFVGGTLIAVLCLVFLYNLTWIIRNHPYQYAYFSPVIRRYASQFSGDYWGISSRDLLQNIAETDPERMITINHLYTHAGSINRGLLTSDERGYMDLTYDTDGVDYFIVCRDDKTMGDLSFPGYNKTFSIRVDDDEIGAVFKKED